MRWASSGCIWHGYRIRTLQDDIDCGNITGNVQTVSGDVEAEEIIGNVSSVSGDIS